jgi:ubiquinone/menaquinone biosynthesis C-methylase UbiE
VQQVASENEEAVQAWDGPLFERFVRFRHLLGAGLGRHGEEALRVIAPAHGERALDIGCGFGETTLDLAAQVGASGQVLGVDASERFIETARGEAERAGVANAAFEVADVQTSAFSGRFDLAYSRMGTMFFANPVAALRNVREALVPGGRLTMVVWRSKAENDWAYEPQLITERFVTKPEDYDEPTCGPGPFSMGNADTVSGVLVSAGFQEIELRRCDLPLKIGDDLDEAVDLVMSIGPAGEILRLAGERAEPMRDRVIAALREGLARWEGADGVIAPASTWIVSARVPPR